MIWELGEDAEIETVRFIFSERAKGNSYLLIAKMLNDQKIPCARRGKWRNKDQKWSTGTIKCIIENPAYYGARAYSRYSSSKIRAQIEGWEARSNTDHPQWRMDEARWVVREGAHEPIVPKELWDKANLVRRERARGGSPRHHVPYLLSGLIKCGRCGFSSEGQSTSLRGRKYYRYVCGAYNRKRVCEYSSLPRDRIETFLIDAIEDVLSGNVILSEVRSNLDAMVQDSPLLDQTSIEKERARLRVCDEKVKRVLTAIEDGGPIPVLVGQLQRLQAEKSEAEMALQRFLIASGGEVDLDLVARTIRGFSCSFRPAFEGATTIEKKDIVRRCVGKVIVDREQKAVRCYIRRFPLAGNPADDLIERLEKAKKRHHQKR